MRRRLWLSIAMLVVGAGLLVAAGFASPAGSAPTSKSSKARTGGTLRLNLSATDVDYMDPALAYFQPSWLILYSTCRMLLNYPDRAAPQGSRLFPDAAARFPKVNRAGTVYTFTIRKGLKFSDGTPINAATYAKVIDRDAAPGMQSPSVPFFEDIKGAVAVNNGRGKHVSGVRARGRRLTIRLTTPRADILSRLAMMFFCAVKPNSPITSSGMNAFPGSGPYYVASRTPNRSIVLKRNRFYRGPRKHNASQIVITVNTNQETSLLQVKRGEVDYDIGGVPPTAHSQLGRQYGVNRSRYFVHPEMTTFYWSLNTTRFFKNLNYRKAFNNGIDRPAQLKQRGAYAGRTTDQLLPPTIAGYKPAKIYPTGRPNLTAARRLMGGKKATVTLYTSTSPTGQATAAVLQANLRRFGLNVDINSYRTGVMYKKCGTKGEPFDICNTGWIADYPDPFDFVDVLLNGSNIHADNNNNYSYWVSPRYIRQMNRAARLRGGPRYRAYGNLDVSIMKNAAPIAPWANANERDFISSRVGCALYHPVYAGMDLGVLCRK